ncbi:hypothetical protein NC99_02760 [Sunxiuqinia dokdonensis]|uniref:Uncharacterized protein n=1 Tax=Sunxiuqinia dokdonensis TaxID=1409788 RepID=A0A0L8VEJ0_9BACT|nr:hypothetical protein NC99_02760 [Sunxiuqinia dokdonensis]
MPHDFPFRKKLRTVKKAETMENHSSRLFQLSYCFQSIQPVDF